MEEAKKKTWEKIIYWGLFIMLLPDLAYLLLIGIEVTSFSSFKIPTESMEPTLIPGDNIYVNKWIMGGRIFDVEESFHKQVEISRLPGVRKLKRNDIIVFNDPYPYRSDTMYMDVTRYYIKRCIALPGDTMEIRNGYFRVNGTDELLGNREAQEVISQLKGVPEPFIVGVATRIWKSIDTYTGKWRGDRFLKEIK